MIKLNPPLIELIRATKLYAGRPVLSEISLIVMPGTATALIGRNGSGKSTLLSILAGLIGLSSGTAVRSERRLTVGYAPEAFPGLKFSAEQYLLSMGRLCGLPSSEVKVRMTALLQAFHLTEFRSQSMSGFSKGMLQKVNLIQSLLTRPQLLLLDEPLSGLDLPAQHTLINLLLELKRNGTALVFSVHEPQMVEALADSVHVLQAGRTVKTIQGRENLRMTPATYIVYKGVSDEGSVAISCLPGIISIQSGINHAAEECTGVTVSTSASDECLRLILGAGGSVVSVEPRGGSSVGGLEQWMDPKAAEGATII
ncbi:ATP-binding cassette domain-containing protein [Paenibacillus sp. BAC0078]